MTRYVDPSALRRFKLHRTSYETESMQETEITDPRKITRDRAPIVVKSCAAVRNEESRCDSKHSREVPPARSASLRPLRFAGLSSLGPS